ncbi:MAG: CRISPR-associated endonuclease Cas2 [Bacteroidota bacterium]|nr:CRISPR-associated endonuclease Cas2 [Bacteroidales bacterium]
MARQKKTPRVSFIQKMLALKRAGIKPVNPVQTATDALEPLPDRIKKILGITQTPQKAEEMTYWIMYDIEDNKIRRYIARYLEKKGFLRVQKSVFLARSERNDFKEIAETLREVNQMYENHDSIILIPVSTDELHAMHLIGKDVGIEAYEKKPNSLIF